MRQATWILMVLLLSVGCASLRRYKLIPESVTACRDLQREGATALERGHGARAQDLLAEAVAANPNDVDARRQLAEVLWQAGQPGEAASHIEQAVKLDPEHGPTLIRAGEMAMALGQNEKAYAWAQRALTLDSGLAGAWALRGRINRGRRQLEMALADLQHALQRAPGDREILLDLAELQMQMGRPQRSLTALHQLLDSFPPGEQPQRALWLEGLAYTAVNRPADAVASLQAASQQGPAHPDLLYQLAKAEELAGRPAAAYRAAQRALAVDSGHQPSQLLLAQLETAGSPPLRR